MIAVARWLPDDTPSLERALVERALVDVGLLEEPPGSNRSPAIDAYLTAVGSPLGSSWCAAALAAWCRESGVREPSIGAGACEAWHEMGKARSTLTDEPAVGRIVLYDFAGARTADHCGLVVRTDPLVLTVEGNTTMKRQTGSEREGVGCTIAQLDASRVLAYLIPEAA
ncbi:MAG TPA: hypothetical protein VN607_05325 [Gemmatimonadaceae bacterium]|nr:hypothetical protein [Gemmatimonadaceae bacterium]